MDKNVCHCCEIANGESKNKLHEIIIPMDGGWVLNHFGHNKRNILGRLVLVTKNHYCHLSKLPSYEATYLGINIKRIESALIKCSIPPFRDDPILGIYVTYFNETEPYHVHMHIFPRTAIIYELIKKETQKQSKTNGNSQVIPDVWLLAKVLQEQRFPLDYKVNECKVRGMMNYLQQKLASSNP